jgi:hypothetical protein
MTQHKPKIAPSMFHGFRVWLGELIHPGQFFNRDASLEIDRLVVELEDRREKLDAL